MTDQYAVIGNPVEHSLSPAIHAEFARATGQDIAYGRILAPRDGFRDAVLAVPRGGRQGAQRHAAVQARGVATRRRCACGYALDAGAVNTLSSSRAAELVGHNTDGIGLVARPRAQSAVPGARQARAADGGGRRGLRRGGVRCCASSRRRLVVANRTLEKAVAAGGAFREGRRRFARQGISAQPYEAAGRRAVRSSSSMRLPRDSRTRCRRCRKRVFAPGALAYDMVYGKAHAVPRVRAAARGARAADGLGMLVEQAAESFFIWRGVRSGDARRMALLRRQMKP